MNRIITMLSLVFLANVAYAERPPEKPTDVVEGEVVRVYVSEEGRTKNYIVEIKIATVVEGKALEKDEVVRVGCFQTKLAPMMVGASGHKAIPKAGDRVKAQLIRRADKSFDGIYSDWYEELPKPKK